MSGMVLEGADALDALLDWFGGGEDPLVHSPMQSQLGLGREANHLHVEGRGIVYYGRVVAEVIALKKLAICTGAYVQAFETLRDLRQLLVDARKLDPGFWRCPYGGPGEAETASAHPAVCWYCKLPALLERAGKALAPAQAAIT